MARSRHANPAPATHGQTPSRLRSRHRLSLERRVSCRELTQFTRQLATLLHAGMPIVRSLSILEDMTRPGSLRRTIVDVREQIADGASLSEAVARHPQVFDDLYVSMIRAGEVSGLLSRILRRLSSFLEKLQRLRKQCIGVLIYPACVVAIAVAVLMVIFVWVFPSIIKVITEMGHPIPALTQALIVISGVLQDYWYLVPALPAAVVLVWTLARATRPGRHALDTLALYLPVFGAIIRLNSISRFCRTLGELGAAGVPLLDSLTILRTAVGNAVVGEAVADMHAAVREGESLATPMRRSGVFDPLVVNMVSVGEETGALDEMLTTIADEYDSDLDALVNSLMSLLEPVLIVAMGLIVGTIVIGIFIAILPALSF